MATLHSPATALRARKVTGSGLHHKHHHVHSRRSHHGRGIGDHLRAGYQKAFDFLKSPQGQSALAKGVEIVKSKLMPKKKGSGIRRKGKHRK